MLLTGMGASLRNAFAPFCLQPGQESFLGRLFTVLYTRFGTPCRRTSGSDIRMTGRPNKLLTLLHHCALADPDGQKVLVQQSFLAVNMVCLTGPIIISRYHRYVVGGVYRHHSASSASLGKCLYTNPI